MQLSQFCLSPPSFKEVEPILRGGCCLFCFLRAWLDRFTLSRALFEDLFGRNLPFRNSLLGKCFLGWWGLFVARFCRSCTFALGRSLGRRDLSTVLQGCPHYPLQKSFLGENNLLDQYGLLLGRTSRFNHSRGSLGG